MRRMISVPVLVFVLCASGALAQQQSSSDPYAPPPPAPQAPSTQPDKNCGAQATRGNKGPWKTSSNCPPTSTQGNDTSPLQSAPNAEQQPKKSTAGDNPFPEDVSKAAADAAKGNGTSSSQAAPNAEQQPKKSTADDNPFPEDVSKAAAEAAKGRESEAHQPAGESSSRDKQTDNLDLEGDRDSRIANGAGGIVHDAKLAADDVHVGQFYLNREDYKGAYARFKEATQADPENPEAVFYLAEAARRMNHKDEAVENYQLYLTALPDGPKAKEAHKALRDLTASAKP